MQNISQILVEWYQENKRDLPWRATRDPYKIWLSEILLQQTRVDQGLPYYLKFVENYPTVKDLAEATEDEVLALWKGLGYYSRGRNLRKAAIQVMNEFGGEFPSSYKDLIKLKGVGEYSAAAIASFAYDESVAVVDGNVYRVLSRLFGVGTAIDSGQGKKEFKALAEEVLTGNNPAEHNQAIMEFGALWCTPKKPQCPLCPFQERCEAFAQNKVEVLPMKAKKIKKRDRYFVYIILESETGIAYEKRGDKDIWSNMYQLPLFEAEQKFESPHQIEVFLEKNHLHVDRLHVGKKHVLSHQNIYPYFAWVSAGDNKEFDFMPIEDFKKLAMPIVLDKFMEDYLIA